MQGRVEEVTQLRKAQLIERQQLTFWRHPLLVSHYFVCWLASGLWQTTIYLVHHPVNVFIFLPFVLWYVSAKYLGYAPRQVAMTEEWTEYVVWWLGLGVLSSIGLGTGMHSGLLFLFPHMLKVCLAAETCGHVDFNVRKDVWYSQEPLHCGVLSSESVPFWEAYRKVWLTAVLWGAGTAVGEVPPYFLSYSAAKAGQRNELMEEVVGGMQGEVVGELGLVKQIVARMQQWMLDIIKRHGFVGVLLLASWPNAAFDLCGICCGAFQMPFWQFFGATLIGKGLIKVSLQSIFFVLLFRRASREALLEALEQLLPTKVPYLHLSSPPAQMLHHYVNSQIAKFQEHVVGTAVKHGDRTWFWQHAWDLVNNKEALSDWLYQMIPDTVGEIWGWIILVLITLFITSCMSTFAQSYKAHQDELEVRKVEARRKEL